MIRTHLDQRPGHGQLLLLHDLQHQRGQLGERAVHDLYGEGEERRVNGRPRFPFPAHIADMETHYAGYRGISVGIEERGDRSHGSPPEPERRDLARGSEMRHHNLQVVSFVGPQGDVLTV